MLKGGAPLAERARSRSGTRFAVYQHGYGPTDTTWAAFEGAEDLFADYLFLTTDRWPNPHRTIDALLGTSVPAECESARRS